MDSAIETSILERLHRLDESHKAEVLDFVEYLASKSKSDAPSETWPSLDPVKDLVRFQGALQFDEDAVAYQRRIRDSEWK